MLAACPSCGGCLHGQCGLGGTFRGNLEQIRVLLWSGKWCCKFSKSTSHISVCPCSAMLTAYPWSKGYDKIPQWPHRAHPFKPAEHWCTKLARESETSFPEDIGLHCVERVWGGGDESVDCLKGVKYMRDCSNEIVISSYSMYKLNFYGFGIMQG